MTVRPLPLDQLRAVTRGELRVGDWPAVPTRDVLTVDLDAIARGGRVPLLGTDVVGVVVGLTDVLDPTSHPARAACDVVLRRDDPSLDLIERNVGTHPVAASALALLLRGAEGRAVHDGLLLESATYSALQAGTEFGSWLASRGPRHDPPGDDGVRLERDGEVLQVVLDRPEVRNALNAATLESLVDAFRVAAGDPDLDQVHLRGRGSAFCVGDDPNELGSFTDPASAHLVRLDRAVGRAVWAIRDLVTAHLHGACDGSGIELPAFAGTVLAAATTVISLPELSVGLIPGAGGTVSLTRRIGRHRTAWLVLTGEAIDATTALAWGLVDGLED